MKEFIKSCLLFYAIVILGISLISVLFIAIAAPVYFTEVNKNHLYLLLYLPQVIISCFIIKRIK